MKTSKIIGIRYHRQNLHGKSPGRFRGLWKVTAIAFSLCFIGVVVSLSIGFAVLSQKLPSIENFAASFESPNNPTVIYDREGIHPLLSLQYPDIQAEHLSIDEPGGKNFSSDFIRIVIPSRDPDFWNHSGSAGWKYFLNPDPVTIAEDLVEDVFDDQLGTGIQKPIFMRILAREITEIYGRKAILTWYLNSAYFGQLSFGADAAAKIYLNKSATSLTLPESVLLCAILKAPALNPIDSKGAVKDSYLSEVETLIRRNALTDEEIEILRSTNFIIFEPPEKKYEVQDNPIIQKSLSAAYEKFGQEKVERGGFSIFSTLDYKLQKVLECLTIANQDQDKQCPLADSTSLNESQYQEIQKVLSGNPVSVTVMDVKTGQLLAAIDTDSSISSNRTFHNVFTPHEPGSSLTPWIALAALNMGYSASSMLWDLIDSGSPVPPGYQNPDRKIHGPVRLRTAMTQDLLDPVAELLSALRPEKVWNLAEKFGLNELPVGNADQVIFSGGAVTTESLAAALIPFANEGNLTQTQSNQTTKNISVLFVNDKNGKRIDLQPALSIPLLDKGLAYLIYHIFGEEEQAFAYLDRPAATKIGRIYGEKNTWMAGFTPQISTAVWVGEKQETDSAEIISLSAIHLWQTIMETAHTGKPVIGWEIPENISHQIVCVPSGLLPGDACPETASEVFLSGNEPSQTDNLFVNVPINRDNQLLATSLTPPQNVIRKTFMNIPAFAKNWAEINKVELIPNEYDPVGQTDGEDAVLSILSPQPYAIFRKADAGTTKADIIIEHHIPEEILFYQISYGNGFFPERWIEGFVGNGLDAESQNIGSLDIQVLEPGLYDIRIAVITKSQRFYQAHTFITIQ